MSLPGQTVVIGGGIVGLCCALYLQREGLDVTLVDSLEPGQSGAKWSCGQMAVSEIVPMSKPGVLRKVPGWMLDQRGPLALRPSAVPSLLPWLIRFLGNARRSRITAIAKELGQLTGTAYDDYKPLLNRCAERNLFGCTATLQVFDESSGFDAERDYFALRRELGYQVEELGPDELAELEPALAGKFTRGVLLSDWRTVKDTEGFMVALTNSFLEQGGTRLRDTARQINVRGGAAASVTLEQGGTIPVKDLVVAAGNGSKSFFRTIGVDVPLVGIGGYQALVRNSGLDLKHSTVYADGGFGFIPLSRGLQIGGTIEFASDGAKPNYERARAILAKAKRIFPSLNTSDVEFGAAFRPFLPDTKPVIDRSPKLDNVVMAFGHGQLGLTLGATTGRLVADLVKRRKTQDMHPFRAGRF